MRIWFVGPGGTRHFVARQPTGFGTGGFYIEDLGVYVDPGPGAVARAVKMGIDWDKVNTIVITHTHTDHYGDIFALVEAVTKTEGKVNLISPKSTYELLDEYHKNMVVWVDWKHLSYTFPTDHGIEGFGILWHNLLYTSDTRYNIGMFPKADVVIGNVVVFRESQAGKHLSVESFAKLINEVEASTAILHHFSPALIHRLDEVVTYLEKETDAKIVIAREGLIYDI